MPVKILRELKLKVREPIVHADDEDTVEDIKAAEEAKVAFGPRYAFALMDRSNTYASGVHAWREACEGDSNCAHLTFVMKDGSSVYRPLTFEENVRARLEDYNTLENPDGSKRGDGDRKRLFNTWLDSCTGIACKKGSTLFKIITESDDLIGIKKGFNDAYLPAEYSQMQGAEFDSRKGTYNELLTKKQVLEHPAWNEAVTDNTLLKNYADLVFGLGSGNKMRFWVRQNTSADELRALYVSIISVSSVVVGYYNLGNMGCFVRVTHRAPKAP